MSIAAKPIETRYRGHRFRSRLEARWAVAFDAARIEWEYEPEGFTLDLIGPYLPDFWLPQVQMWAEVKPTKPSLLELQKARALSIGTGHPVLLLISKPSDSAYWAIDERNGWVQHLEDGSAARICDFVPFDARKRHLDEGRFYSVTGRGSDGFPMPQIFDGCDMAPVIAAASARFEFGESGAA